MVESGRGRRMAPGCSLLDWHKPRRLRKTQVQDQFSGVVLSRLSGVSVGEVFAMIGEIELCPLCGGRRCAARLGGVPAVGRGRERGGRGDPGAPIPLQGSRSESVWLEYVQRFAC